MSFDSFEVRNPSLPEDLRKSISKLSVGQSGHHLTSNYDLDRPWRGDISLFREYEANLASSFQSESAEKSEGDRMLSTPSFSCVKLSSEYDPYKMCSDIVDYSFYLPTGTTLDDLEETVRASVPATFSLMTGACLSDYKKMTCARVYTPCVDNGKSFHFFAPRVLVLPPLFLSSGFVIRKRLIFSHFFSSISYLQSFLMIHQLMLMVSLTRSHVLRCAHPPVISELLVAASWKQSECL